MAAGSGTEALSVFLRYCYLPEEGQQLFPCSEAGDPADLTPCRQHIYVGGHQVDMKSHCWSQASLIESARSWSPGLDARQ